MDSTSIIDKVFPGFATTGDTITTVFDSGILILFVIFLTTYLFLFRKYAYKIHGIVKILKGLRDVNPGFSVLKDLWGVLRNTLFNNKIQQQNDIIKSILKQNQYTKGIADSLVEYNSKLYLSQDVDYYINENTLAPSILCSRLFPLGAALLTGLGVLGTFVGLLLGLDGLVGSKTTTETLSAIDQVTSGASVAFATSVTGVFFSLLLNLIEKSVTSCMAVCVRHIQEDLSDNFPPFPVMDVFKDTGENSKQSADTLGELAERIGGEMQKSMDSFLQSMFEKMSETMSESANKIANAVANSLDFSLRDKLVPAVNRISAAAVELSERQVHSSEEALKSVVEQFMEKFGQQGEAQRKAMLDATEQFQQSSSSLSSSMDTIMLQMKEQQDTLTARQQEQMEKLSNSFSEMSAEQGKNIELAGQEIRTLLGSFSGQMAEEFRRQTASLGGVTDNLHSSLSSMMEHAKEQQDTLIARQQEQMEKLSNSFCEMSAEQGKNIELAGQEIRTLLGSFSEQMAEEFRRQTASLGGVTDNLHSSLSSMMDNAKDIFDKQAAFMKDMLGSVNVLLEQGKTLQFYINETKDSFNQVAEAIKYSSNELAEAGGALERFGKDITRSVAEVSSSVEKTTSLYMALEKPIRSAKEGLDALLDELDEVKDKFAEVAEHNSKTVDEASKNYKELAASYRQLHDKLHEHVKEIGEAARKQVQELQKSMTALLDDYGQKVDAQVSDRMSEWNSQTEKFCDTMVAAIDSYAETVEGISDVVDKIKEK